MKKFATVLLTLCITLSIVGCGDDTKAKPKDSGTKPPAAATKAK
jgi:hypothetical protein